MITYAYFALLGGACLLALSNWRQAVYAAILLDFLRDPVRKLDPSEPVLVTISVLLLWAVITFSAWGSSQSEIRSFLKNNPRLLAGFRLLVFAMIPGSLMAMLLYSQGYKMVVMGLVSYLAPTAGLLLGAVYAKQPQEIDRLLRFYCIVNGVALLGVVAEYTNIALPALGGLRGVKWIRYSGIETVDLIGGFYRSPDIMGLHAAQVVMFSLVLFSRRTQGLSTGWLLLTLFGALCLILSGRRKMLGIPLVFVAASGILFHLRGIRQSRLPLLPVFALVLASFGVYLIATDDFVADEYTNFAATLFTDGASRSQEIVVGSVASTLAQSGLVGSGLGSATQGAYHLGGGVKMGWQEDGVSRLFKELGVIGVILVFFSLVALMRGVSAAVRRLDRHRQESHLQVLLLATVVANLASFVISHQQYSGDPPSAIIVLMVLGMAVSLYPGRVTDDQEDIASERSAVIGQSHRLGNQPYR